MKKSTPTRIRPMVSFTLDPDVVERLEAWLGKQEFPPTKSQVVETAIRDWLDRREKKK